VVRKLVEKKQGEIFCLARPSSDKKFLKDLGVHILDGDLKDPQSLDRALEGTETLFHAAADYRLWAKKPQELMESNVIGTRNILQAARHASVKRIVYTSSVSAVGRPHLGAGDETMDPSASHLIGPYKKSKYWAELEARRFAREGLNLVIVNPSTPIGSHDVKPTPTGKLILDFLRGKMPAYLNTGLNLVDVEDVAEGHLLACDKGKSGERYILGNKNLTLKEILEILSKISGRPAPKIKIPYWVAYTAGLFSTAWAEVSGRPPEVPLDGVKMAREAMFYKADKAVRELGLPQTPVEKALEKAVKFFRDFGYCV